MLKIQKSAIHEVLPLRHRVLRRGRPIESARFEEDDRNDTQHYAAFEEHGLVVGVLTLIRNPPPKAAPSPPSYQIRGMAVDPGFQGKNVGSRLLSHVQEVLILACDGVELWCNARENARSFYEKQGFKAIEGPFDIPGIGTHYRMQKTLRN